MLKFIEKLLGGSKNDREIRGFDGLVVQINQIYPTLAALSDEELRQKTTQFKARITEYLSEIDADIEQVKSKLAGKVDAAGDGAPADALELADRLDLYQQLDKFNIEKNKATQEVLDELLPEAFAVVKETCRRMVGKKWIAGGTEIKWDMIPYDVQLIGGIVIHKGRISEMKTGEGKTLVGVAPMYLNALAGRGVHVVTVNPYLAQRDSEWMAPIFEFLGLTVGCIDKSEPHTDARKAAYNADITYGTNNEFGFDYLRDNSFVSEAEQLMQREHHFAIVDEVDSVLIDEARTPLIIAGPVPQEDFGYFEQFNPFVDRLVKEQQKLVASLVSEGEKLVQAGKTTEGGVSLFRAHRGYPRNRQLIKLKQEPQFAQLIQKTEGTYLQDNARRMPEIDDELYYALDEKQETIEMTDKGRRLVAQVAGFDEDFFVIPDLGEAIAQLKTENDAKLSALEDQFSDLSESERIQKRAEAKAKINGEKSEKERQILSEIALKADRIHAVNQLLRAYTYYEKDVEYIIQDGKVMIVDEQTGRVLGGRRYSDGLHQAIEAKEKVKVEAATQTYATITLQNYFRMYNKLAGMTGTALTEAGEFYEIYKLEVNAIPTHRPVQRQDLEDLVYRTKREKYNAVLQKIQDYHTKGQPVLVGTTSVEVSETLSRMLKRTGIPHNVLNAKLDQAKNESMIVAEAGQRGAVTIATNMAGRGTDIKLGEGIQGLGGLAILGTERHESRRIDLQLRGRSGRQGDPGESQFYVSLEDDLMRLFGHDRTARMMEKAGMEDGEVITHPWISKGIERAQKKVEQNNFSIRKRQVEYDDVLNAQREVIYDRRMHALKGERMDGEILQIIEEYAVRIANKFAVSNDVEGLKEELLRTLAINLESERDDFPANDAPAWADNVNRALVEVYQAKRRELGATFVEGFTQLFRNLPEPKPTRVIVDFTDGLHINRVLADPQEAFSSQGISIHDQLERNAMLNAIDDRWTEHLRELDDLKEGIGLRAYAQKDPLIEYKMAAYQLFEEMLGDVNERVIGQVFRMMPMVEQAPARQAERPKRDMRKFQNKKEHHDDYGVSGAELSGSLDFDESAADRDPTVHQKQAPIVAQKAYGRNDIVTIINPMTGMKETVKYKNAQNKLSQGWQILD